MRKFIYKVDYETFDNPECCDGARCMIKAPQTAYTDKELVDILPSINALLDEGLYAKILSMEPVHGFILK